jgi:sortase B
MKKKKPNILFIICLVVLIAAVAVGIGYKVRQQRQKTAYEDLAESVAVEPVSEEQPEEAEEAEDEKTVIPVDFEALQEQNQDIYAWIRIPDTQVDYPVLQSETDVDYYLDHTVDKVEGLPGSIYTQYTYNPSGFVEDAVTVVYGHNMRDGSMFGDLSEYLDEEYRTAHPEIQVYTPEHIYTYRIAFCVTFDDRLLLYQYDCSESDGYEKLLTAIQTERLMPSWMETPFEVTTEDRMIILSTCNGNSTQRFLVGAILTNEE